VSEVRFSARRPSSLYREYAHASAALRCCLDRGEAM